MEPRSSPSTKRSWLSMSRLEWTMYSPDQGTAVGFKRHSFDRPEEVSVAASTIDGGRPRGKVQSKSGCRLCCKSCQRVRREAESDCLSRAVADFTPIEAEAGASASLRVPPPLPRTDTPKTCTSLKSAQQQEEQL